MVVGVWDSGDGLNLDVVLIRQLQEVWRQCAHSVDADTSVIKHVMADAEQVRLAPIMRRELADWRPLMAALGDAELVDLVRFFALAEAELTGWEAGKRSPAIACARELRARGSYPSELTKWLRKHSSNRFLPYGSLLDS